LRNGESKAFYASHSFKTKARCTFFEATKGLIALEVPRSSRSKAGAKFWFNFDPLLSPGFLVESKQLDDGRNHKLNGTPFAPGNAVWSVLVADDAHNKEMLIKELMLGIQAEAAK
jgi:hypothetical protein